MKFSLHVNFAILPIRNSLDLNLAVLQLSRALNFRVHLIFVCTEFSQICPIREIREN